MTGFASSRRGRRLATLAIMTTREASGKAKESSPQSPKANDLAKAPIRKPELDNAPGKHGIAIAIRAHGAQGSKPRAQSRTTGTTWSGCFGDWLDKPLARLGRQPALVVERHDKITKENGPYIANGSMRSLRAVYNHARKGNTDFPAVNPRFSHRLESGGIAARPGWVRAIIRWLEELCVIDNPIRREFHLITLLSGSRPTALKRSRHRTHRFPSAAVAHSKAKGWRRARLRHSSVEGDDPLHHSRNPHRQDDVPRPSESLVISCG